MLGIIGAMDEEVAGLISAMELKSTVKKAGMTFYSGKIEGLDVTLVRCGIGKVNAAVCAQILIDIFEVDAIVNTGIAGSLDASVDIADVVISSDVLHHDMDAVGFGYEPGQIPRLDVFSFNADAQMVDLAEKACEVVENIGTHRGRIVSGDQFVSDKERKNNIKETFGGMCTEMEGAAIGQTAHLNGIPFVVIRTISDKADDTASMDYSEFEKLAIKNSLDITVRFCQLMKDVETTYGNN